MTLQSTKRNFFVAYIALAIASTGTAFTQAENAKQFSASGLGASILGLISTELAFGFAEKELEKSEKLANDLRYDVKKLEKDIETNKQLTATNTNKLTDEHTLIVQTLTDKLENSKLEIVRQEEINTNLVKKLEQTQEKLTGERDKLRQAYQYNSAAIHEILRKSYEQQVKYVEALIEGFSRFYPEHRKSFDSVVIQVDSFKSRYQQKISEYAKTTNIQDLLEDGLELQRLMIETSAKHRLKVQTIVISHLQNISEESVTFTEEQELTINALEQAIDEANQKYDKQVDWTGQVKDKLEGNIKAFAQEFIEFRDKTVTDYRTEFTEILDALKDAAYRLENYEQQILSMEETIQQLRLPHLFPGAIEKSNIANAIINHYWQVRKICLDCAFWTDTELGYVLHFYVGRNNGTLITPTILNDQDAEYQLQQLSQSLELPKFRLDTEKLCMSLEIVKRRKTKSEKEITLPKSVKTADKFAETVAKWERVRITGGSESGKSPTAENVAICILKARNSGLISFYDPMHDSVKNYRSVPPTGVSHADSIKGLKEFADLMQNPPSQDFQLVWFDEIDSTMDESPSSSKYLMAIFKQASHKNLGLIVTGQNSNVTAISGKPPIQRSDMKNMTIVHIGSNYEDGLANSNLPESEKKKLGEIGLRVTEWCEHKNNLEGLEATGKNADVNAYRFALVLEPQKRGYFMLLPEFGLYDYSDLALTERGTSADLSTLSNNKHTLIPSQNDSSKLSLLLSGKKIEDELEPTIKCTNCGTSNTKPFGTQGRYECLNPSCSQKTFRPKK